MCNSAGNFMKAILIPLLVATLTFQSSLADIVADVLPKARKLVEKKHYQSAYEIVQKADPEHRDLEAVLFKCDLLWSYYASRIGADLFALRDLANHERIEDVRGAEGTFEMFQFETEKTLARMLEQHPEDARIYRALGHFQYKQLCMHPDAATEDAKSYADTAAEHLNKAVKAGLEDDSTHFALGHMALSRGDFPASIAHFNKCIELNPDYAAAHFNLASARFEVGLTRDALESAKSSLKLYTEPHLKSDAASLAGDILAELGEDKESLRHYELADEIQPDAYPNIKSLLMMRLRQKATYADATALRLMALDPDNPTVFGDLEEVHMTENQTGRLIQLYNSQLELRDIDRSPVATGNIHFYLARLYLESEPQLAQQHFKAAKICFEKQFQPGHPVFKVIENHLKNEKSEP
jgi:tetratricopeptide (TPR) repeat protein